MSLFTSPRERRLWIWTLVVLIAIYSTLGLAGTLAGALRARGLLAGSFALGFVLVIAAVAGSAWVKSQSWGVFWVALGIAAVYGMVVVRMGVSPEERTHLFEYGLVAILIHQALTERMRSHQRVLVPAILAVAGTALLGWVDEGIQALLPNRVYDIRDVGVNALAGLMAVAARLILAWARRRLG